MFNTPSQVSGRLTKLHIEQRLFQRLNLNIAQTDQTINTLLTIANDRSLSNAEMAGGASTISNGGIYGHLICMPIIE